MEYGKLGFSDPVVGQSRHHLTQPEVAPSATPQSKRKRKVVLLVILSITLLVASAVSAGVLIGVRKRDSDQSDSLIHRKPTQAISRTCSKTLYPSLCVDSLLNFPGSLTASESDLVHISFNMTLQHLSKALYSTSVISYIQMEPLERSAFDDCLELLEDSIDAFSRALLSVADQQSGISTLSNDVLTWLSAALTNQDTCKEGFENVGGEVKKQINETQKDLTELVSNCLAIFSGSTPSDFSGVPIQNRRRLMESNVPEENAGGLPKWLHRRERELLDMPPSSIQADIVVSKDGENGTYKTIAEAIKDAPENSDRRTIIYVRAGRYEEENLKVGRKKKKLMFIGDGKGKTVITGSKSVSDKMTTFHTATFAATGAGFIARDMSFENSAGPGKHQAVALRVGADQAVVYRCDVTGYQDTLYVHSNRQFFRECDVYGTVDFIFGNAAVVFQNCNIFARKPMASQKNTITAQNRKDPNQNTGISIHNCQILPTSELKASQGSFPTYLGRPWKLYSRVVYMESFMEDHISPRGWLEWNGDFALDTLYYGEYMNKGPGAAVAQRVNWKGFRVITSKVEASRFTVAQFIYGSSWLPSTGVAFVEGL